MELIFKCSLNVRTLRFWLHHSSCYFRKYHHLLCLGGNVITMSWNSPQSKSKNLLWFSFTITRRRIKEIYSRFYTSLDTLKILFMGISFELNNKCFYFVTNILSIIKLTKCQYHLKYFFQFTLVSVFSTHNTSSKTNLRDNHVRCTKSWN